MPNYVMYKNKPIENTLTEKYMTTPLKKAQKEEAKKLAEIILQLSSKKPITILDIGVGDGRIPSLLKKSVWDKIESFSGFDNSKIELNKAKKNLNDKKIKLLYFDANRLNEKKTLITKKKYDLIICTYFTAGNFKPDEIKMEISKNGKIINYPISCLNPNKKFIHIFKSAYRLLRPGGKIILGSVYIDSDSTRIKQEAFYRKCGMKIITSKVDSFTATQEGFWSQRFTAERIYDYFAWLKKEQIQFWPLDNYNFAEMVIISK